jgi:hypothetical protein
MEITELKKEEIAKLVDFFATYALSEEEKEHGRMMFVHSNIGNIYK